MVEVDYLNLPHKITPKLGWATAIASLGTLQFGFHLAELNGPGEILSCKSFKKGPLENYTDTFWGQYKFQECIPMDGSSSIAIITTLFAVGGLLSSIIIGSKNISNEFGRKVICFANAALFLLGSMMMALANSYWLFCLGRLLNGFAGGAAMFITPILVNEITPTSQRGFLGSLLQLAVAIGIFLAQFVSYFWSNNQQWRYIFVFSASLALFQFFALFTTVESPKWLIVKHGDINTARDIMNDLRSNRSSISHEINHWQRLSANSKYEAKVGETTALLESEDSIFSEPLTTTISRRGSIDPSTVSTLDFFLKSLYRKELFAVIIIMSAQQLAGMNAITFYGVKIMESVTPPGTNVILLTCSFSLCNVISLLAISPAIDKLGRRPLLLLSAFVMGFSAFIIAVGLNFDFDYLVAFACFLFIFGYSVGFGPIPFMMVSELAHHEAIAVAQSVGTTINWFSSILIAFLFPILQSLIGGSVFFIFFAISAMYFLLIWVCVPETKGLNGYNDVWNTV
ncbi:uncharacterized protein PRCAT00001125001 [Priceomyces carsonii]|uniref:uncharacterized protein n=1 Tax=Priceomyces carsonii TaxID=28549 RepID=UPI002ED9A774|nr:unnamed protein product [Priceomyces carsonii]